MGKAVHDDVLDGAHNVLNDATTELVCSAQPTTRAEALSLALADVAMAGGDFTISDGDTSGRKVRMAAKNAVPVDTSGTATHVALIDAGTRLLAVTICASQALTAGNTANLPAWDYEIADPT